MSDAADRLSRLSTHWPELAAAHAADPDAAHAARCAVLRRYCGAVYHYLLAATRSRDAADELGQEFALRFVRGDFHRADPDRGRFRDFVKTVLYHLIADHYRGRKATPGALPPDLPGPAAGTDAEFARLWRAEILDRTWDELERLDGESGQAFYPVLRWRVEHPDRPATDGADATASALGRPLTAAAFRQTLHRARERFADLLLVEVAYSLGTTDREMVTRELADLELLAYCRPAVDRWEQ